ncbi:MAG: polysaccharide biosynthesis protein [Bacillota bacterium]
MAEQTKTQNSFVKQAAILAAASILVRFLGFVYRVPLTNMIGDEGNAIYSAGYYIYTFLLILSSAGLPAAISKLVAERVALKEYHNAHRVFRCALWIAGSLGLFCSLLFLLFSEQIANFANTPEAATAILTLSPTLFIVAVMSVFRGYFQGMHMMVPTAISQIVEQVFNAVFSVYMAFIFLRIGVPEGEKNIAMGAAGGTMGTGIGAFVGLCTIGIFYFWIRPVFAKNIDKCYGLYEESYRDVAKILMMTALPIIAGTAVFSITNLVDMNMVTKLLEKSGYSHTTALELYGQLSGKYVTLTTLPISISTVLATAVIPSIAASMKLKNIPVVHHKIRLTFRISMILSFPSAVGIGILGDPILHMLFPLSPEGGSLLVVGSVSILFLALCQTATGILQGIGHLKIPVMAAVCGAFTKIILNYLLIPIESLNILGAIWSTTGCYLVASLINMVMLSRITGVKIDVVGTFVKPLLGSAFMGVTTFALYKVLYTSLENVTVCTMIAILFAVIVYGLTMLAIGGLTKEDILSMPKGKKIVSILTKFHLI